VVGSDNPSSFGAIPLEEEMYTPPITRSCTEADSLGFNATYLYQYMDDHFSCLKLRRDGIDERQQQHAQDQHELLHQQWTLIAGNAT